MDGIDRSRLVPAAALEGEDEEDTRLLAALREQAVQYLSSFEWCGRIDRVWFGGGVGGVVAVFLFEIEPAQPEVDDTLWVIAGDLPPAYLVTDESPDAEEALHGYIIEMRRWIEAVRAGKDLDDVIPVNVPATADMARQLEIRLDLLEQKILPAFPRPRSGR